MEQLDLGKYCLVLVDVVAQAHCVDGPSCLLLHAVIAIHLENP